MATVAVLGIQWGDEGKGKVVDALAARAKLCGRYNGGANAGHTLEINGQKLALHLLPCGVMSPNVTNLIGSGVVLHLQTLAQELDDLAKVLGDAQDAVDRRIVISSRCHLTFDFHRMADAVNENRLADQSIGTTLRGIGPSYGTKAFRLSLRACDLLLPFEQFRSKYEALGRFVEKAFGLSGWDPAQELAILEPLVRRFAPLVTDAAVLVKQTLEKSEPRSFAADQNSLMQHDWTVVVEGANAVMLDLNCGTYPYVTSSDVSIGGVNGGLPLNPRKIDYVLGVTKAYCTRVGEGPFPTELTDETGVFLRDHGHEYGASTGRPRRCGWLDLAQLRYALWLSGCDSVMMTKLDVLSGLPEVKVATGYRDADGQKVPDVLFPASLEELSSYTCEYEVFEGWTEPLDQLREYEALPKQARVLVERLETLMGVPIRLIGVGPDRTAIIEKKSPSSRTSHCPLD